MTASEKKQQAARDRLTELSATYTAAETALDRAREILSAEIVSVLKARTLGPSEVTRLVPFERQHVGRIAKAGGVPPLREPTVVSAKQATQPAPVPSERPSPPAEPVAPRLVAGLTSEQLALLAERAFRKAVTPEAYALLTAAADKGDRAVVEAAMTAEPKLLTATDVQLLP
jgi:hypothetical protein